MDDWREPDPSATLVGPGTENVDNTTAQKALSEAEIERCREDIFRATNPVSGLSSAAAVGRPSFLGGLHLDEETESTPPLFTEEDAALYCCGECKQWIEEGHPFYTRCSCGREVAEPHRMRCYETGCWPPLRTLCLACAEGHQCTFLDGYDSGHTDDEEDDLGLPAGRGPSQETKKPVFGPEPPPGLIEQLMLEGRKRLADEQALAHAQHHRWNDDEEGQPSFLGGADDEYEDDHQPSFSGGAGGAAATRRKRKEKLNG